jgi:hypothetical protein
LRDCVVIRGNCKKCHAELVELAPHLIRGHLIIPRTYETLKQVQGDKIVIPTQPLEGERIFELVLTPPRERKDV